MNGEPEPVGESDKLDTALHGLFLIWLGLLLGGATVLVVLSVATVISGGPMVDGDVNTVLVAMGLLMVPAGIVGAWVLPLGPKPGSAPPADETEPMPAFGAYAARLFIRAGLLEGAAIVCMVLMVATSSWVLSGAAVVSLGALTAIRPTRAGFEAFAEDARRRSETW